MPTTRSKSAESKPTHSEVDTEADMEQQERAETTTTTKQADASRSRRSTRGAVAKGEVEVSPQQSGRAKKARFVQEAVESDDSERDEVEEEDVAQIVEAPAAQEKGALEAFLACPLDILAEIFGHLPPATLLQLARTAKLFRSFLLSRQSRATWIASRANSGLPKLKYLSLSEIQYAVLLFGQLTCHSCHTDDAQRDIEAGLIFCYGCRSLVLCMEKDVKKLGLHADVLRCVPEISTYGYGYATHYRRDDLEATNIELSELQDLDEMETEQRALLAMRGGGSRTRRASGSGSSSMDPQAPHSERVKHYVAVKEKWALGHLKERKKLVTAVAEYHQREQAARIADWQRQERMEQEAEEEKALQMKQDLLDLGWSEQDYKRAQDWSSRLPSSITESNGLKALKDNPARWLSLRDAIKTFVEKTEAEEQERIRLQELSLRQAGRKTLVRDRWSQLRNAEEKETFEWYSFPPFSAFADFPSVKPFWEFDPASKNVAAVEDENAEGSPKGVATVGDAASPGSMQRPEEVDDEPPIIIIDEQPAHPSLDESAWKEKLDNIVEEVAAYRKTSRVEAIRIILCATTDTPLRKLSTDPSDYPESEYDNTFFSLVSSLFVGVLYDEGARWPRWFAVPFPVALHLGPEDEVPELKMNAQGVATLRAILDLGGLDEETATTDDLDELGPLKWRDFPVYKKGEQEFEWPELINEVSHRLSKKKSKDLSISRVQSTPYTTPHRTGVNIRRSKTRAEMDLEVERELEMEAEAEQYYRY